MVNDEKDAAIQKNLDQQSKTTGVTGRRVTGELSYSAQSEENYFGLSEVSTSIDAVLAVNKANTSSSYGYFQTVVNSMLSPLDCVSADGIVHKYISIV